MRDYRSLTGLNPSALQARNIVAITMNDPPLWRQTVEHWLMHGWKPRNISGMLDLYRRGGPDHCNCRAFSPAADPGKRNPGKRNTGRLAAERARLEAREYGNRARDT